MKSYLPAFLGPCSIMIISAYLALQGLADHYFWDDEAGTAIFAENFLRFGKLTAWDGRNLMAYRNGMELDADFINRFVPPLQFFLAAASFRLLGISTFSGRLPFALTGLASLVFFYLALRREAGGKRSLIIYGLLLLAFSPSFLLFIRQCRYFSLTVFFPLLCYYSYKSYSSTHKLRYLFGLAGGLIGLFFSHYLIFAAFAYALLGLHLKYYVRKERLFPYLTVGGIVCAAIAAYIFTSGIIFPAFQPISVKKWLLERLIILGRNFREINAYNFFPWGMLPGLIWLGRDKGYHSFPA